MPTLVTVPHFFQYGLIDRSLHRQESFKIKGIVCMMICHVLEFIQNAAELWNQALIAISGKWFWHSIHG